VLRSGGVRIVLTTRRKVFFCWSDFAAVGLDPAEHDVVVVKVGYLFPEQREMASAAFMALSPGAVHLDIPSLPYHQVQRPIFPLDPEMDDPDLTPLVLGPIGG
jgi:microcystin degradation protein MlrC